MPDPTLASFVETVCEESHLRVETDFGGGFVRLKSAEAERRQAAHDIRSTEDIVIELLRNARDAHVRNIFLAVGRDGSERRLTMLDDGDGVPPAMHERIFEPRVTSKLDTMHLDKWGVHGRGMALYSIAVNATSARVLASDAGKGTALAVLTDLSQLGERRDQSTFPTFEPLADGAYAIRGPRNIVRTACEFALEERSCCSVYCGSATEVAATLLAMGQASTSPAARAFCTDPTELPVCKRLGVAATPAAFAETAATLGLVLGERSARRILDGDIKPLPTLSELVRTRGLPQPVETGAGKGRHASKASRAKAHAADDRGLRLAPEDSRALADAAAAAFAELAPRYYLEPDVVPEVHVTGKAVRIVLPVEKLR